MPSNLLIESASTSKLSKSSTTSRKFRLFKSHQKRKRPRSVDTVKYQSVKYDQDLKKNLKLRITIAQARQIAPVCIIVGKNFIMISLKMFTLGC